MLSCSSPVLVSCWPFRRLRDVARRQGYAGGLLRKHGVSDGRFYGQLGIPAVAFGVGGSGQHGPDELAAVACALISAAAARARSGVTVFSSTPSASVAPSARIRGPRAPTTISAGVRSRR